jgi:hypothetical protein
MHQFKLDEAKRDITDAIEMKNDVM